MENIKSSVKNIEKLKQFLYRTITGPEGPRRLRLPDFERIGHKHRPPFPSLSFQKIFMVSFLPVAEYNSEHSCTWKDYFIENFQ